MAIRVSGTADSGVLTSGETPPTSPSLDTISAILQRTWKWWRLGALVPRTASSPNLQDATQIQRRVCSSFATASAVGLETGTDRVCARVCEVWAMTKGDSSSHFVCLARRDLSTVDSARSGQLLIARVSSAG